MCAGGTLFGTRIGLTREAIHSQKLTYIKRIRSHIAWKMLLNYFRKLVAMKLHIFFVWIFVQIQNVQTIYIDNINSNNVQVKYKTKKKQKKQYQYNLKNARENNTEKCGILINLLADPPAPGGGYENQNWWAIQSGRWASLKRASVT